MTADGQRELAENLFEAVAVDHNPLTHIRRKGETGTLCDRDSWQAYKPHPTEKVCKPCFSEAESLVHRHAIAELHNLLGWQA